MSSIQTHPTNSRHPYSIFQDPAAGTSDIIHNDRLQIKNRPRRNIGLTRWDSTFDIHIEDVKSLREAETPSSPAQISNSTVHLNGNCDVSNSKSLIDEAPRRVALGLSTGNAANTQKRRTSTTNREPHSHLMSNQPRRPPTRDAEVMARRRTIYVPAEDTTMLTIHPGAPSGRSYLQQRPPRRSDVFLDLATLNESSIFEQGLDERSPVVRRNGLAELPKRRQLRPSTRQLQGYASVVDVPGSGPGKENIPPGYQLDKKNVNPTDSKVHIDNTADSTKRIISPSKISYDGLLRPLAQADLTTQLQPENYKSPAREVRAPKESILSFAQRQDISSTPKEIRNELKAPSQQTLPPVPMQTTPSKLPRPVNRTPSKLSLPILTIAAKHSPQQYRILSEHIANPELYEDKWLSHQERTITGIVNELFQHCEKSNSTGAAGQSTLRKELLQLYDNDETAQLHKRLQASLRFGMLSLPSEAISRVSRFKDDVGQSRKMIDLWMKSYDPHLLQAAAEVVIGREMAQSESLYSSLHSVSTGSPRHASKALERFLLKCLLRNKDVQPTPPGSVARVSISADSVDDAGSAAWSLRRTTMRTLLLILLIDRAARSGTFQGCVFLSTSQHKSSASLLQAFIIQLIPSVGGAARALERLSYQVCYVQYPLQEYKYRIENLATDLRDGILLTRLVELLLYPYTNQQDQGQQDTVTIAFSLHNNAPVSAPDRSQSWPLSHRLKFPCASRVQKLFNVTIALEALRAVAGFDAVMAGIEARDIVDGHREKTVGLLWGLVGRWGISALVVPRALEMEIQRLAKIWNAKSTHERGTVVTDVDNSGKSGPGTISFGAPELDHLTSLLLSWARYIGLLHGVSITNLSTSFADGRAYAAIATEYSRYITPIKSSDVTLNASTSSISTLHDTLRSVGCSPSLISLFPLPRSTTITIPGKQSTIPLLAFLASRLLPAARPCIAAIAIQKWWRNLQRIRAAQGMWGNQEGRVTIEMWQQRRVKAVLARECRDVVGMQGRLVVATGIIQRWWRSCRRERRLRGL